MPFAVEAHPVRLHDGIRRSRPGDAVDVDPDRAPGVGDRMRKHHGPAIFIPDDLQRGGPGANDAFLHHCGVPAAYRPSVLPVKLSKSHIWKLKRLDERGRRIGA